jgi:xanthine phosphoribosyltransferase
MDLLKQRIVKDGRVIAGDILKVDSFLNHQMDIDLFLEIGKEFHRLFQNCGVNKILTIEASGIGIACITAQFFRVPIVFAKKNPTKNIEGEVHLSHVLSYTNSKNYNIMVSKRFLGSGDCVLLIDDFLANGSALMGLIDLVENSGARLAGAGIVIEKGFQGGGALIRKRGVRLESLAVIEHMSETGGIVFKG